LTPGSIPTMPLSCYCDDYGDWFHEPPDDYSTLDTKRCRKCASCRERIPVGALVLKMFRYHFPRDEIQQRIYGYCDDAQIPMASRYLCERCGDLYLSLTELGYCLNLGEDMRELVRDYADIQRERGSIKTF
jgi:ferredoxin